MERPRERRRRRARAWSPPTARPPRCDTPPPRFPRGAPRLASARSRRGAGMRRAASGHVAVTMAFAPGGPNARTPRRSVAASVAASCVVAAANRASDVIADDAGDAHRSVASATTRAPRPGSVDPPHASDPPRRTLPRTSVARASPRRPPRRRGVSPRVAARARREPSRRRRSASRAPPREAAPPARGNEAARGARRGGTPSPRARDPGGRPRAPRRYPPSARRRRTRRI